MTFTSQILVSLFGEVRLAADSLCVEVFGHHWHGDRLDEFTMSDATSKNVYVPRRRRVAAKGRAAPVVAVLMSLRRRRTVLFVEQNAAL